MQKTHNGRQEWWNIGSPALRTIIGGTIFCLVFAYMYRDIPAQWYQERDDALITLSHAKNWVDYGVIGVNPSGGKVEGFSAPLSFFMYAVCYFVFGIHYTTYLKLQTWVCTFMLGCLCSLLSRGNIFLTVLGALLCARCGSFFMWHASGMENAFGHVFVALILWGLIDIQERDRWLYALAFSLAMIVRVEGVYWFSPLFLMFVFLHRKDVSWSTIGTWFGLAYIPVFAVHLFRWSYFGDIFPNTAYAQDIDLLKRLHLLILQNKDIWHYSIFLGMKILLAHGSILLLVALPWIWSHRNHRTLRIFCLAAVLMLLGAFLSPFLFGAPRLAYGRLTTHISILVVFFLICVGRICRDRWYTTFLMLTAFFPSAMMSVVSTFTGSILQRFQDASPWFAPKEICCSLDPILELEQELDEFMNNNALHRPAVAVADVGLLSWRKKYNILDVGRLTSPVMAKERSPEVIADYFFDVIAPDIIALHGDWLCMYQDIILADPRFDAMYRAVRDYREACPTGGSGLWVRADVLAGSQSKERLLINRMQRQCSLNLILTEHKRCQEQLHADCNYIDRTMVRFSPELILASPSREDQIKIRVEDFWTQQ